MTRPRSLTLLALWAVLLAPVVHADQVLVAETTFFEGSESQTVPVSVSGAGVLDISLTDLAWPDKLASLSFFLSNGSSLLTPQAGSTTAFKVTDAETLYVTISGLAGSLGIAGLPNFGLYSLDVTFAPQQAPVPILPSAWLLISGLAALLGTRLRFSRLRVPSAGRRSALAR